MTDGITQEPALAQDGIERMRRWSLIIGRAQQTMLEFWARESARQAAPVPDAAAFLEEWAGAAAGALKASDTTKIAQLQADYLTDSMKLWEAYVSGAAAEQTKEQGKDSRFASESWRENPGFDLLKQAYLLTSRYLMETTEGLDGLSPEMKAKARFYTRQFIDAMSPSNFLMTNPDVLNATVETGGENLLKGLEHMLDDISRGRMKMTDEAAFQVGVNVASTPGKVVYENRLFQLIHYEPQGERVYEVPLLIFPPWINKYYILDLTPQKSFVRWAVEQGLDVFLVSWRNPGPELSGVTIDDYVGEGYIEALEQVSRATGVPQAHTIGYCVAGTTLAATLAYLSATGQADRVRTATFFTAQVDFEDAGDLKVFIDDVQLSALSQIAEETGVVDGRYLAASFNLLRSNELIWSYVVNNYLLGKDYFPFDLLFWNSDAVNVPGAWHRAYLRDFYKDNKLARAGGIAIRGVPIDLGRVATPAYVQAGKEDHIAPPKSVYKITRHFTGPVRFVLAGSGHIAGVVNPPSINKYQHWVREDLPAEYEEFPLGATEHKGSWWPDWLQWLLPQSGPMVPARRPENGPLPVIEDAPGRYVAERI
jgi:polyhydroxyalkanoate synthase